MGIDLHADTANARYFAKHLISLDNNRIDGQDFPEHSDKSHKKGCREGYMCVKDCLKAKCDVKFCIENFAEFC